MKSRGKKLRVKYLRTCLSSLKRLEEELREYGDAEIPELLPDSFLDAMVGSAEQIALSLRSIGEQYAYFDEDTVDWSLDAFQNLPVTISFNDGILRMKAPFCFQRSYGNKHNLSRYLEVALLKY